MLKNIFKSNQIILFLLLYSITKITIAQSNLQTNSLSFNSNFSINYSLSLDLNHSNKIYTYHNQFTSIIRPSHLSLDSAKNPAITLLEESFGFENDDSSFNDQGIFDNSFSDNNFEFEDDNTYNDLAKNHKINSNNLEDNNTKLTHSLLNNKHRSKTHIYNYSSDKYITSFNKTFYNLFLSSGFSYSFKQLLLKFSSSYPIANYKDLYYNSYQKTANLSIGYENLGDISFGYSTLDDLQKPSGLSLKLSSAPYGNNQSQVELVYSRDVYSFNLNPDNHTNTYQINTLYLLFDNLELKNYFGFTNSIKPLVYTTPTNYSIEFNQPLVSYFLASKATLSYSNWQIALTTANYFIDNFLEQMDLDNISSSLLFNNLNDVEHFKYKNSLYNTQNNSFNSIKLINNYESFIFNTELYFKYITEKLSIFNKTHQQYIYGVNFEIKYQFLKNFTSSFFTNISNSYLYFKYNFEYKKDQINTITENTIKHTIYTHLSSVEIGLKLKI